MSKVLYIKANARPDGISRTYRISESFISAYKESNPGDEIITLDLYKEGIKFLPQGDLVIYIHLKKEKARIILY